MRLVYNNEQLDVYGNGKIVTSHAVNSLKDLSSRQGVYSNTFTLPGTANNVRIFKASNVIQSNTRTPYSKGDMYIDVAGVVFDGRATLRSYNGDFELNFIALNSDFWDLIKDKDLADLDLTDFDHGWTRDNVIASLTNTEGYIYPCIDYHSDSPNLYLNIYQSRVDTRTLFPSVFVKTLVDKIFLAAGFNKSGFDTIEDYDRLVLPYVNGFKQDNFVLERQIIGAANNIAFGQSASNQTIPFAQTHDPLSYLVGGYFNGSATSWEGVFKVDLKTGNASNAPLEYFRVYEDDGNIANQILIHEEIIPLSINNKITFSHNFFFQAGVTKRYYCVVYNNDPFNVVIDGSFIVEPTGFGRTWIGSEIVPEIKQSDLIKSLMNMYNLVPCTTNRTMSVVPFKDILSNRVNAYNWDVLHDETIDISINYHSNFARKNRLKYKEDEFVLATVGDSFFDLQDETLDNEQTAFELPFAYTVNVVRMQSKTLGNIPMLVGGSFENKATPRILKIYRETVSVEYFELNTGLSDTTTNGVFASSIAAFETGKDLDLISLKVKHYSELIDILDEYKEVEVYFKLPHSIVAQLDFNKPVYFKNEYFYIDEVIQHDWTSTESTLVKLIHIK